MDKKSNGGFQYMKANIGAIGEATVMVGLVAGGLYGATWGAERADGPTSEKRVTEAQATIAHSEHRIQLVLGKGCEHTTYVTLANSNNLPKKEFQLREALDSSCSGEATIIDHEDASRLVTSYIRDKSLAKGILADEKDRRTVSGKERIAGLAMGILFGRAVGYGGVIAVQGLKRRRNGYTFLPPEWGFPS